MLIPVGSPVMLNLGHICAGIVFHKLAARLNPDSFVKTPVLHAPSREFVYILKIDVKTSVGSMHHTWAGILENKPLAVAKNDQSAFPATNPNANPTDPGTQPNKT